MSDALTLENTAPVASVGHRLAIGVQWIDALSRQAADERWVSDLDAIGARACALRFDLHPMARHALRAAGRLARLLQLAADDKVAAPPPDAASDPTNFVLRAYGQAKARDTGYATGNDPRQYVPRRLSLTPAQTGGTPTTGVANIRSAWLWPGSVYPMASGVSALRGSVRRGASLEQSVPVAWSRVVVTRPGGGAPDFATEAQLGCAHGDDRGEFLLLLGPGAIPGGAELPATIDLHVWVFLPPADVFDADDPLASLPLEVAGEDAINDLLRGTLPPAHYLRQDVIAVALAPGTVVTLDPAQLLFV